MRVVLEKGRGAKGARLSARSPTLCRSIGVLNPVPMRDAVFAGDTLDKQDIPSS
jgi:hypothetical protein